MSSDGTLKSVIEYASMGLSVIPITHKDKRPDFSKLPSGWKPYQYRRADESTIIDWFANSGSNAAVITGAVSKNLIVIDFDDYYAYEQWIKSSSNLSIAQNTAVQRTAKGVHLFLQTNGVTNLSQNSPLYFPNSPRRIGDIKGEGGYVLVAPSIHPSGKPYEWISSFENGVYRVEEDIDLFIKEHGLSKDHIIDNKQPKEKSVFYSVPSEVKEYDVEKAVMSLPTRYSEDYHLWSKVGMAIKNTLGQQGFTLWINFSKLCKEKFSMYSASKRWNSFIQMSPGIGVGLGSLIYWSKNQ